VCVCFGVQVEYDGVKEFRAHNGIDTKIVIPKASPRMVSKTDRTLLVDGLLPRATYSFNISAEFMAGMWGPVHRVEAKTSIGG